MLNDHVGGVLIQSLGEALGISPLALDENGMAGLQFSGLDVFLLWLEDERSFVFCAPIRERIGANGDLEVPGFCEFLLGLNALTCGVSHGAVALASSEDAITLNAVWHAKRSDSEQEFGEALLRFVEDSQNVQEKIGQWFDRQQMEETSTFEATPVVEQLA